MEFVKRSRNQPGFLFIKSRWYDLEYDGRILQQEDWGAIKPFTDIFVDLFLIQRDALIITCPWCKSGNSLPSRECADVMWYVPVTSNFSLSLRIWYMALAPALTVVGISLWRIRCKLSVTIQLTHAYMGMAGLIIKFWGYESRFSHRKESKVLVQFVEQLWLIRGLLPQRALTTVSTSPSVDVVRFHVSTSSFSVVHWAKSTQ